MSLGGNIVPVENLAESLQVAADAGAKRLLLPMASVGDIPTIPGELFAKFQTGFYADPSDAVFKALGGAVTLSLTTVPRPPPVPRPSIRVVRPNHAPWLTGSFGDRPVLRSRDLSSSVCPGGMVPESALKKGMTTPHSQSRTPTTKPTSGS